MINGIYAATLSLLNEDLGLDIKNTISHAEKVIDNGCHGVVFFGSTGQSQLISLADKIKTHVKSSKRVSFKFVFSIIETNSFTFEIDIYLSFNQNL